MKLGEMACPRCAETIKNAAVACKHCGYEFTPEEIAEQKTKNVQNAKATSVGCLVVVVAILFVAMCSALSDHKDKTTAATPVPAVTPGAALDTSTEPVKSCEFGEMLTRLDGVPTISGADAGKLCQEMEDQFGALPQTRVLRSAAKAAAVIQSAGVEGGTFEVGQRLVRIAKARGQSDPDAILRTFELVTKEAEATHGEVTPNDIHQFLKASGEMAHTLSDDGLVNMLAVVWEEKKAQ